MVEDELQKAKDLRESRPSMMKRRSLTTPAATKSATRNFTADLSALEKEKPHAKFRALLMDTVPVTPVSTKSTTTAVAGQQQSQQDEWSKVQTHLERTFEALDNAIMFFHGRNQVNDLNYHKLQKPVMNMTDMHFDRKHLAQIIHIYPDAFTVDARVTNLGVAKVATYGIDWKSSHHESTSFDRTLFMNTECKRRRKEFKQLLNTSIQKVCCVIFHMQFIGI